MSELGDWIGLVAIGFAIGSYAGAIGAGGGFLLAPVLLLRHSDADPAEITTGTLTIVLASSAAFALAGVGGGRLDRQLAVLLIAVALPRVPARERAPLRASREGGLRASLPLDGERAFAVTSGVDISCDHDDEHADLRHLHLGNAARQPRATARTRERLDPGRAALDERAPA